MSAQIDLQAKRLGAAVLTRLFAKRALRGAIGSAPLGALIEQIGWGFHDDVELERMKQGMAALAGKLEEFKRQTTLPGEVSLEALPEYGAVVAALSQLSDENYATAEPAMLELIEGLPPQADTNQILEKPQAALRAIKAEDAALTEQATSLRNPPSDWFRAFIAERTIGEFIAVVRAVQRQVENPLQSDQDQIWYLDANVLFAFVNPLRRPNRFAVDACFASYLLQNGGQGPLDILQFQRLAARKYMEALAKRKYGSASLEDPTLPANIIELCRILQEWRPMPLRADLAAARDLAISIRNRLGPEHPYGSDEETRAQSDWDLARAIAVVLSANGQRTTSRPCLFVTLTSRMHEMMLIDPNLPVQHIYGPTWALYATKARDVDNARLRIGMSQCVEQLDAFASLPRGTRKLPAPLARSLTTAINRFGELIEPFHQDLADHVEKKRRALVGQFDTWLDQFSEGAVLFKALISELTAAGQRASAEPLLIE